MQGLKQIEYNGKYKRILIPFCPGKGISVKYLTDVLLCLPKDTVILDLRYIEDIRCSSLIIESDSFPTVQYSPIMSCSGRIKVDNDGNAKLEFE